MSALDPRPDLRTSRPSRRGTRAYQVALAISVLLNVVLIAWIVYYPSIAEVLSIVDTAVGLFN